MMIQEFIDRTGYTPEDEEYKYIEQSYYDFAGFKDDFCKWWKKAYKSGEWKRELALRKDFEEIKGHMMDKIHELEDQIKMDDEGIQFYKEQTAKFAVSDRILKATGMDVVKKLSIQIKNEPWDRLYDNVKVRYIDNGKLRFINVIEESGWTTSFKLEDVERIYLN